MIADKLPVTLDRNGAGKVTIDNVPQTSPAAGTVAGGHLRRPQWRGADAAQHVHDVAGRRGGGHQDRGLGVCPARRSSFQALALQHNGPNGRGRVALRGEGRGAHHHHHAASAWWAASTATTTRPQTKDLGTVCSGKSDARGLLLCESKLDEPGEVELIVDREATPPATPARPPARCGSRARASCGLVGRTTTASTCCPRRKLTSPAKPPSLPGAHAVPLCHGPGGRGARRHHRHPQVVQLNGQDPTVRLKVQEGWGPNVYVSVLALRGRLREVPWYSFFTWGFKAPREWWTSFWYEGKRVPGTHGTGGPVQARLPTGPGRDPRGHPGPPDRREVSRPTRRATPCARKARVTITAKLPNGQARRQRGGGPGRGGPGVAGADAQHQLEPARTRCCSGVQLGRGDLDCADGDHRPAPLRSQGRACRRRRRQERQTRELLDTLLLWEPPDHPRRQWPGQGDGAAERRTHHLQDRGRGRSGDGPVRHRPAPASAPRRTCRSSAACRRWCARTTSSARRSRLRNTTQEGHEGRGIAARHAARPETADHRHPGRRGARGRLERDGPGAAGADPCRSHPVGDRREGHAGRRQAMRSRPASASCPAVPLTVQQATLVQVDGSFQPGREPAGQRPARPGRPQDVRCSPSWPKACPACATGGPTTPLSAWSKRPANPWACATASCGRGVVAQLPTYLDSRRPGQLLPAA